MKLRVGYCDGLAIEVVGQDMDAFVRSSLWKVRLAAVKRRALDPVGQIILFPPDLTRLDIEAVLAKLGDVAARNPELEIELDGSLSDAEQQQNAGIIQKAAAGNAIKARSAQVDGEFAEFSRAVDAMMARPLRDRQMWDAFFMCSMGKSANFSVPGSGKTASTLGAFGYLRFAGKVDRLIVVGPMSSFGSWVDEWVSCFGSPAPRVLNFHDPQWSGKGADARRRELSLNASRYDLILLNYEMLAGVAEQVDALTPKHVVVIPSQTVPQGVTAMLAFSPEGAVEENTDAMTQALGNVDTMQITYAARNSDFDGYDIHEGDYLALYGNQLFGTSTDIKVLLRALAEKVRDDGKEYVTIYYGEDVKEKYAQKTADLFADICPNADVNLLNGGQPVYYYLISAE